MKQLFPKEILDNTVEVHQFTHSAKSQIIYVAILLAVVGLFVALPFFTVTVQTTAPGILKPNKERIAINVINGGRIVDSRLVNNKRVAQGDTLLVMDNNGVDDQLDFSLFQLEETTTFIKDLSRLLSRNNTTIHGLLSPKYQRAHLQYSQELEEVHLRLKKVKRDLDRHTILYRKGVVSKSEWENSQFEHELAVGAIQQLKKRQQNTWQADLSQYRLMLKELLSKKEQLLKTKSQFVVTAPISGTLLHVRPQEFGSLVPIGSQLGEISPDTELLAECYVDPSDIGLLRERSRINFQIDAYHYNQWGMATGHIMEIGKDIELLNDRPVFKVRCKIQQKYLELPNGFQGTLKKGMTLRAHFKLTERSLFQLLYDKMDDWLNPGRKEMTKL